MQTVADRPEAPTAIRTDLGAIFVSLELSRSTWLDLPIAKQAEALNISRGSVYYLPRPVSAADLALMRRIDELHLEFPFAGSRMLRGLLAAEGCKIGRRHVKTLMKRMGIEALYPHPLHQSRNLLNSFVLYFRSK